MYVYVYVLNLYLAIYTIFILFICYLLDSSRLKTQDQKNIIYYIIFFIILFF